MQNFRQFEAGPDPFGRNFQVLFKWMQTAISIRHADTVDVKFVLVDENGGRAEKTIALPHAELLEVAGERPESGRSVVFPTGGDASAPPGGDRRRHGERSGRGSTRFEAYAAPLENPKNRQYAPGRPNSYGTPSPVLTELVENIADFPSSSFNPLL